jgi:hypothetical protein
MTAMHVFPDTNVLVHFPALDGFDWLTLCCADEVIIHITPPVITELNKIKEIGHIKRLRKRAASVQRRLKDLLKADSDFCFLGQHVRLVFKLRRPAQRITQD